MNDFLWGFLFVEEFMNEDEPETDDFFNDEPTEEELEAIEEYEANPDMETVSWEEMVEDLGLDDMFDE